MSSALVKINIKNFQNKLSVNPEKIKKLIRYILRAEKINKSGWINICLVNNPLIKKFNSKFHHTHSATDVLAFNLSTDKKIIQADIIVSTDMAKKQAKIFKTTPDYELSLYFVHGVLHILGYDDNNKKQTQLMRKKESKYVY